MFDNLKPNKKRVFFLRKTALLQIEKYKNTPNII